MLQGKNEQLCITELKFDPENPRIPVELLGSFDESKVLEYMIKSGNVTELMSSITELGYTDAEPLLVTLDEEDGKYIVVEGNRRLAALKLINNPELATLRNDTINTIVANAVYKPDIIPCIIYSSRDEVLDYLGYRHITGVKEWGALEKATYLNMLYDKQIAKGIERDEIYRSLARMIGSRADYVRKLHMSYQLYILAKNNAFYKLKELDDFSFSWITAALGYSQIQEYIGLGNRDYTFDDLKKDKFEKLFNWLFNRKIVSESRRIGDLAEVVGSEIAISKLDDGYSLDEALLYSSHPYDVFINVLTTVRDKLRIAMSQIEPLNEKPEGTDELLSDIEKLTKSIIGAVNANFPNKELLDKFSDVDLEELYNFLKMKKGENA